jgi:hypothetical protein
VFDEDADEGSEDAASDEAKTSLDEEAEDLELPSEEYDLAEVVKEIDAAGAGEAADNSLEGPAS